MQKFKSTIEVLVISTLMVASLLLIFTTINFLGFQMFVVRSGSMEPAIKTGAVVFDLKKSDYNIGETITFKTEGTTVTHRITAAENDKFIVKGDANSAADTDPVEKSQIIGRVIFSVPYLGFFVEFLRSFNGLVLFIIIPAAILVYEELKNIGQEIKKIKSKEGAKEDVSKIIAPALLICAALALSIGQTSAYFTDSRVITGNVFSTGYWGLAINEVYPSVAAEKGAEGKNDWVELYNPTSEAINLKGYSLVTKMGYFPISTNSVSIPAGGYVLLAHDQSTWKYWEIGKEIETVNLPGNYNKPDWLIATSDHLYLKNPQGHTVDEVSFGNISSSDSYARFEEFWTADPTPTPGQINN